LLLRDAGVQSLARAPAQELTHDLLQLFLILIPILILYLNLTLNQNFGPELHS
jgi:hypothetical protein